MRYFYDTEFIEDGSTIERTLKLTATPPKPKPSGILGRITSALGPIISALGPEIGRAHV